MTFSHVAFFLLVTITLLWILWMSVRDATRVQDGDEPRSPDTPESRARDGGL